MTEEKKQPIVIRTFGDIVAAGMTMTVYCSSCDRRVELNPAGYPTDGVYVGRVFRCSHCGRKADLIVNHVHRQT